MMNPQETLAESKRILDVLRVYKSYRVEHDIFHSAEFDLNFNQIRIHTEKDMVSDHLATDYYTGYTTSEWPASTWQMFKHTHRECWWMARFVTRHPVRMQGETQTVDIQVKRYLGYPEAVIPSPRLGRAIKFEQVNEV